MKSTQEVALMRRSGILAACLALAALARPALADDPAAVEFFEKNVRPILVERCQGCHGAEKQKSGLRLDSRAAALAGGLSGPAVEPGKPDESLLVDAVNYGDFVQMPPKSKLPDAEIAALTRWVEMGAPWPGGDAAPAASGPAVEPFDFEKRAARWSFGPIARTDPPEVRDAAWPLDPIDRFLLARLESANLRPAPEADRRALIRRVTFDLTGLPPAPADVEAFAADTSPDAYERLVDRLLASPRYGERWGRHWLDLVRFAETSGHEFDYDIPNAWRYRDYVVRALNADLPYDQFLVEHLAGDLLENPRRHPTEGYDESVLGTAFFALGEGTHSPVDIREEQMRRIDNQLDVVSKTFLGLTVTCARCHDHKFDPIRQADYYALAGFLKSSRHGQAMLDPGGRIADGAAELRRLKADIDRQAATPEPEALAARVAAYAEAAWRLVHQPEQAAGRSPGGEVVFADFEGPTYAGWTPDGDAFGDAPLRLPVPSYQGDVACRGQGLVGSHNGRISGSVTDRDALTGTLTSPAFRIEHAYIGFLVGGGAHAGRTCINLVVDGAVVRSVAGRNENRMRRETFDVRPFLGREARLVVVDRATGGWGNISLDHVVFTDDPRDPLDPARGAEREAAARGLDPVVLARWIAVARDPESSRMLSAFLPVETPPADDGSIVFADFDGPDLGGWTATGEAFGGRPSRPGDWRPGASGRVPVAPGRMHSGLLSDRLEGVLRSPTFTIEHPYILSRVEGRGGRLNLVIDGFEKIRSPIYGGLAVAVDADRPRWIVQDVSMWVGHRAYLELADGAVLDFTGSQTRLVPGEGYVALDEVRFADSPRTPADPVGEPVEHPSAWAGRLGRSVADTFEGWRSGRVGPGDARRVEALGGLVEGGLVPELASAPLAVYRSAESAIPAPVHAPALGDGTGEDEFLLPRGDHKRPGEAVPRRMLEVFGGLDQPEPEAGSGRLALARRLVDPEATPLTARVIVNRVWQHHFGRGLAATPDDFGLMGQPPSHPELLDYLASEFIDGGWSLKALHRRLVLTRAYRMSSRLDDPEAERLDPENRLLHRRDVRRLEAEAIRDAMLAVSGRLDTRLGGPSVPTHLTPFMEGRGRPSQSGPLDGDGRRSLYLNVRRNFLAPMLLAFDHPPPATTMGRRNVSNVPAQALTLLDDPFVLDQARAWADRVRAMPGTTADRIDAMFRQAFGRHATEEERARSLAFLGDGRPSAWDELAHVLLNVKEFIFVE
jgi:cytochrome c553